MDLPEKISTFEFEHKGLTKKYEGRFSVKCHLNMGEKHQLAMEKTRLLADYMNPTDDLAGQAVILSKLRVHIVDGPEWWQQSAGGFLIDDEDAIVALYDKVLKAENEWREKVRDMGSEAKKKNEEQPQETQTQENSQKD